MRTKGVLVALLFVFSGQFFYAQCPLAAQKGLNGMSAGCDCQVDGSCPTPTPTPTPTPPPATPTPTPAPTPNVIIQPKYVVLAVTYAPPGANSFVEYNNSTMFGTSLSLTQSVTAQTSLTVTTQGGFSIFGFGELSGTTVSQEFTQEQDSSESITINKTTSVDFKVMGPSSSAVGLSHDADIIWVWLNPVFTFTVNPNGSIVWTAVGFDERDQPELDVLPIPVAFLNGHATIPQNVLDVLARRWATPPTDGSGTALTPNDYSAILAADPSANASYIVNVPASSTCTADQRYCLLLGEDIPYAPPPPGQQPVTVTVTLTYETIGNQGQGFSQTSKISFADDCAPRA